MRIDVLGISFDEFTLDEAVAKAIDIIDNSDLSTYVVTPNPEIVWMARRDEALRAALNAAGMVLPDGVGIVIGARILGTPLRSGRVPGIDFADSLFARISQFAGSVYLLGAKPGVAEQAGENLAKKHPGLVIAGAADGYYKDDESLEDIIEDINKTQPDVLLVCLGSPNQEFWMQTNLERLNVKLCAGLGGSLDVFAGNVRRAPIIFRKLGIEWLFRLCNEPRRIKRMIKIPLFVMAAIKTRMHSLIRNS